VNKGEVCLWPQGIHSGQRRAGCECLLSAVQLRLQLPFQTVNSSEALISVRHRAGDMRSGMWQSPPAPSPH